MNHLAASLAVSLVLVAGCRGPETATTTTTDGATTSATGVAGGEMVAPADPQNPAGAVVARDPSNAMMSAANSPQQYVAAAAASDMFEIQSSELVLRQSQTPAVRRFAQQMINDHRSSTEKLKSAAQNASIVVPAADMTVVQRNQLKLLGEAGDGIDETYLGQQRDAHANAIALHQSAAANSALPAPLSAFAAEVVPTIQGHARMLNDIKI